MADRDPKSSLFSFLTLVLGGIGFFLLILIYLRLGDLSKAKLDVTHQQDFASELVDNKLW